MTAALPLSSTPSIVVVSDRAEWTGPGPAPQRDWMAVPADQRPAAPCAGVPAVEGGYLERLPLACINAGLVAQAEVWHHCDGGGDAPFHRAGPHLAYRGFHRDSDRAPFASGDMMAFLQTFGAPHILVVYGLGIAPDLLDACANSVRVYNSIDAPALRVPPEASARFDLVLTGAQWQSDEVIARHPGMATAILPVGPEFAGAGMFRPLGLPKTYDLVYVAAAQPYKRHDLLLDALAECPRDVRALCVIGYGEGGDSLRAEAAARELQLDCVGPPGVPFAEVNRLMNLARFGVVCGRDDGAPAILTEYMLAGLPVLANAELVCGRQYIRPDTGMTAAPREFARAIMTMRDTADRFAPRDAVLANWTWPHSIQRLAPLIQVIAREKI